MLFHNIGDICVETSLTHSLCLSRSFYCFIHQDIGPVVSVGIDFVLGENFSSLFLDHRNLEVINDQDDFLVAVFDSDS